MGMKKIDKFHRHEILDRCVMLCDVLSEQVLSHPAVTIEMKVKLDTAIGLIYEAGCIAASNPCKRCGMPALIYKNKKKMVCTQCLKTQKIKNRWFKK